MTNTARICIRCVLPESPPDIVLDANSVCNICHNFDKNLQTNPPERNLLETDFMKLLSKHRGKNKYDCLCMLSGGKDSTAALFYIKRKYKLNPLVFTFNHGFIPEEHLSSARKTVEILNVDWLYFKTDFMKDLFRKIVETKTTASICPVCSLWYMSKTYEIAAQFDISLIISGWTKGQTTGSSPSVLSKCACDQNPEEFKALSSATREFLEQHVRADPKYADFPRTMEEVLTIARKKYKNRATVLSPHWFMPQSAEEYVPIIQKELGWNYPATSFPKKSTNCELNFLASQLTFEHFGYSHYHIEMSNLIRLGLVTREEALEMLKMDFDPSLIRRIKRQLGITSEE